MRTGLYFVLVLYTKYAKILQTSPNVHRRKYSREVYDTTDRRPCERASNLESNNGLKDRSYQIQT